MATKTYSLVLDDEMHAKIEKVMDTFGFSFSAAVRYVLKLGLEQIDK